MQRPIPANRRQFLSAVGGLAVISSTGSTASADDELVWKPATELAKLIRERKLSPVELVRVILKRAEALNPKLNAFLHLNSEFAIADARLAETAVMRGEKLGLLHGVPVSIKDSHSVKGMPTTNGCKITGTVPAVSDSPLVEKTRAAGGVIFGKTNLPAFAHIDITYNQLAGPCPSPWDLKCNSGGSSGGAGAACAAGIGPLHHGTDGGGSIRIPADRCGIFGFKPSIGRIGHPGSLKAGAVGHDGPMTRTVADAALLMDVWSGPSRFDYLSIDSAPPNFSQALSTWEKSLKGKKIGLTFDYGWTPAVDPEVRRLVGAAAKRFTDLGCVVEEVSPKWPAPIKAWEAFWFCTAAAAIPLFKGHEDWIDPTLKEQMDVGAKITGAEMAEALEMKDRIFQAVERFFTKYDLLLSPVCAVPTFPFGKEPGGADGVAFTTGDVRRLPVTARMPFTPTFNMTGHPAASVPCGFTKERLPVGLHVVAGRHQDALVLQACAGYESIHPWSDQKPSI